MRRLALLALLTLAVIPNAHAADARTHTVVVFFQEWSAALDEPAQQIIAEAAAASRAGTQLTVTGFADPTGSRKANVLLSQLRAQRVADILTERGVAANRVKSQGQGSVRFALNAQESRRVEITFQRR